MKVLLIDDDDDVREIVRLALVTVARWDVSTAASGQEGIARLSEERPDVVLLDVMMPDMDGPATLQALRRAPASSDVPVIFLTAKVQQSERSQLVALGAKGVIAKPFDPILLSDEISDILRGA